MVFTVNLILQISCSWESHDPPGPHGPSTVEIKPDRELLIWLFYSGTVPVMCSVVMGEEPKTDSPPDGKKTLMSSYHVLFDLRLLQFCVYREIHLHIDAAVKVNTDLKKGNQYIFLKLGGLPVHCPTDSVRLALRTSAVRPPRDEGHCKHSSVLTMASGRSHTYPWRPTLPHTLMTSFSFNDLIYHRALQPRMLMTREGVVSTGLFRHRVSFNKPLWCDESHFDTIDNRKNCSVREFNVDFLVRRVKQEDRRCPGSFWKYCSNKFPALLLHDNDGVSLQAARCHCTTRRGRHVHGGGNIQRTQ